jgi:hypothetical protein
MKKLDRSYINVEVSCATGISRDICKNILDTFVKFDGWDDEYNRFVNHYADLISKEHELFGEEKFIVTDSDIDTEWQELRIEMEDFMNGISPEMCHFGSHEGNGSLLGFWHNESEFSDKQYDNIIRRKSFLRYQKMLEELMNEEKLDEFQAISIIERIHSFIDGTRGYKTKQNADNANESVKLLKEMVYGIRLLVEIPEYCDVL